MAAAEIHAQREKGWERFAAADWEAARDAFAGAVALDPDDPEAHDGLGQALWWLGRRDDAIEHRQFAYAAYVSRGERRRAGGVAAYLAGERRIDGQDATGAGWLARARRLLADEPTGPEHGWLAVEEAKRCADPSDAERHARTALAVAHSLADPDVECMALAQLGRAAVRTGRVEEGTALLDEAMTVALGGESRDPLACGDACCTTLVVCDALADLDRAAQWCEAVVAFTERRRFVPVQAWCRGVFGGVLIRAGDWAKAEEVLVEAVRRESGRADGPRALPLAVLADLRLRQGRTEEAEQLLGGLDDLPAARGTLVRLHVALGDVELARALLDDGTRGARDDEVQALRGEVALAAGDADAALRAAKALAALAGDQAREDLHAQAALLAGRARAAVGDGAGAARSLDDAVGRFTALRWPHEAARARLALAGVQAAAGSPLARRCAQAARDAFDRLGARPDADRAAALLRELGASGRATARGDRDALTAREREVLALVAAGLSNGAIAERLVIAPKTAEHHVSRVLAKLGVRSRAEAAAHAVRLGI